jgi:sugar-specific transcriptional regulator TrmB
VEKTPSPIATFKNLETPLKNLGFNEKEAKVYLALLELGPSAVREISLKSGLKKPTTYVILDELRKKEAVLFLPGAKKKLYSAKSPDDVFQMAKLRLNQAMYDLPLLKNLSQKGNKKAIVTYYEGVQGYEQAMSYRENDIIEEGELLCYFASAHTINPAMFKSIDEFLGRLRENGVRLKGFAPDHESLKRWRSEDQASGREVKVLPLSMYSATSSIDISRNFVRFTLFGEEMFVIIENAEIAKIMRQIFEMNWGNVGFYQKMLGSNKESRENLKLSPENPPKPSEPTVFPNIA